MSEETAVSLDRLPRTAKGLKTRRAMLDAAALEFAEKGFHDSSIIGITQRAGVALGSFYTYFASKDEIFRAVVRDLSEHVGELASEITARVPDALEAQRHVLKAYLDFAREHKEIYRIIDQAEYADPESYRLHYETAVARIMSRLQAGAERGELRADVCEAHVWAIIGMNVFLGLRFGVWSESSPSVEIADIAHDLLVNGLARRPQG
jgi:AcrR family transcriptional regulator